MRDYIILKEMGKIEFLRGVAYHIGRYNYLLLKYGYFFYIYRPPKIYSYAIIKS